MRIAVAVLVMVAVAGFFVHYGSPSKIAHQTYHSFTGPPTGGQNLNSRLFSFSNNGRTVLWHAAWNEFRAHPVAGGGAGSFQRWWFAHRTTAYYVTDTHNLYAQTLGELGAIGGVLLALFLGLPLVAAFRARWHPLTATALGGYVAYLVHCIVDWDWQVPAVTLLALFTGAALVVAARGENQVAARPLRRPARIAIGAVAAIAAVVAFVGLIGNIALARSNRALLDRQGQGRRLGGEDGAPLGAVVGSGAPRRSATAGSSPATGTAGLADLRQRRRQGSGRLGDVVRPRFCDRRADARPARSPGCGRSTRQGPELAQLEHPPATKK